MTRKKSRIWTVLCSAIVAVGLSSDSLQSQSQPQRLNGTVPKFSIGAGNEVAEAIRPVDVCGSMGDHARYDGDGTMDLTALIGGDQPHNITMSGYALHLCEKH